MRAYTGLDRFAPGTRLRAWLLTIAANLARDLHRKKSVRREVTVLDGDEGPDASPLDAVLQDEREALVRDALASIPADLREAVTAYQLGNPEMRGVYD